MISLVKVELEVIKSFETINEGEEKKMSLGKTAFNFNVNKNGMNIIVQYKINLFCDTRKSFLAFILVTYVFIKQRIISTKLK